MQPKYRGKKEPLIAGTLNVAAGFKNNRGTGTSRHHEGTIEAPPLLKTPCRIAAPHRMEGWAPIGPPLCRRERPVSRSFFFFIPSRVLHLQVPGTRRPFNFRTKICFF